MKKIVIIGAGAMGSAFTVPCADNSHEVFLVGSFLEDDLINEINKLENFHPILKCQLPKKIKVIKFSAFNKDISKDTKIRIEIKEIIRFLLKITFTSFKFIII